MGCRPRRSRRALVPLLLLALVSSLVVGCGGGGAARDDATAESATATDILARASRRLAETPTVHFHLDVAGESYVDTGKNIRLLEAEGDLQRPDRVSATFKAEVLGRTITLQLITVGDQTWTTNILTGAWGPAPKEFAYRPTILFDNQDGIGPVMGRVQDARRLEDEEVDGRPTYHVVAEVAESVIETLTYKTMTGSPVIVDLWIDRETDDLLRARLSEPPTAGKAEPAVWTLDLSDHGEKVSIEPPV